ncbi:MAG: sortase [Candidatus Doudnabacteria bacterium]|nr:sortase [Candidatus Doudnabacteria bacterium]
MHTQFRYALHDLPESSLTESGTVSLPANTIFIPSLGIQSPIVPPEAETEPAFQEALKNGVVRYPGTAAAGEQGNMYIFGHSSDYVWSKGKYKTVFALLPNITKGAVIFITNENGRMFVYVVKETFVVRPDERWVLTAYGEGERLLTLQTSYPLGTALKRFIVRAELR